MLGDSHLPSLQSTAKHLRSDDDQGPNESPKRPKHHHPHRRYRSATRLSPDEELEEGEIVDDDPERGSLANAGDASDVESGELKADVPNHLIESGKLEDYKLLHCNMNASRDGSTTTGLGAHDNSSFKDVGKEAPDCLENEMCCTRRRGSMSPKRAADKTVSGESIQVVKSGKEYNHKLRDSKYDDERRDSYGDLEVFDPMDLNTNPKNSKYEGRSPSDSRQIDELLYRKRSKSPKYGREQSRSREYARGQSGESGSKHLSQDAKNDRLERYVSRSRVSDDENILERESSSYTRYDDRRESPVRGKIKERNSDDTRGKEKAAVERCMDREGSYSRHDRHGSRERREDRHENRDRREGRHESRDIRDDNRHESRDRRDDRHESKGRRDDKHESRGRRDDKHESRGRRDDSRGRRDDRHGSRSRRDDRHGSRDIRDDRHGSRDRLDDRHGSQDRRDDRYESRDRREGRLEGRGTKIEREMYVGSARDSYAEEREYNKSKYLGKASSKDGAHGTDKADNGRENSRARDNDGYRYRGDHMEKDRVSRDKHNGSRNSKYDDLDHYTEKSQMKQNTREPHSAKENEGGKKSIREEDEEDYQERIEQQLANKDEDDLDKIKEESRKRRQAILEKYKQKHKEEGVGPSSTNGIEKGQETLLDEEILDKTQGAHEAVNEVLNDRQDSADAFVPDASFNIGKSPNQNGLSVNRANNAGGLGEGTPKSERSADMFTDDIFGESPTGIRRMGKGDAPQIDKNYLHDNWDDAEGYYSYRFGEVLDGRYEIIAAHGKGVFSTVVRAKDLKPGKGDPEEVAIKIIRSNETMFKAGQDEYLILKKLAGADPEDKRHCVRFLSCFKYRNHFCLVFESLHMNLREVLKKFGRNIGLKLTAVRAYAKQLFIALKHLRNCGVLHCDIKPDNMLVNEAKNVLKLCDFGNAMFAGKNEVTPYLVSRFYRAPEIILGLPYDHPMDMWSVGCCLYELYTGKVLFPGPSNNDMLRLHMELKGPFPKKMLRKGAFVTQHFDQDLNFHALEEDPVTKKAVNRLLLNIKPKDIGSLITGSAGEDQKIVLNFKDLLDKIFVLDPEKRLTVSQALSHPFITGK